MNEENKTGLTEEQLAAVSAEVKSRILSTAKAVQDFPAAAEPMEGEVSIPVVQADGTVKTLKASEWLEGQLKELRDKVAEMEKRVGGLSQMRVKIVEELPTVVATKEEADEANNIYYKPTNIIFLVPHKHDDATNLADDSQASTGKAEDAFDEYIWVEDLLNNDTHWEKLGNTDKKVEDVATANEADIDSIFK